MNLKNILVSGVVCGGGFVLLGACHAGVEAGVGTGTVTSAAAAVDNEQAIHDITEARCNRAMACNDIGDGKSYADFQACSREIGRDTGITLRSEKCPNGILTDRLSSCLDEINTERCGNPLDTLERVAACRKGMLCK